MSRISIKNSGIKLEIQINEQVKFGKIAYRAEDAISKVFHDLKRIKILPGVVEEEKVKYYDKNNQELPSSQQFALSFDLNEVNHLIKLSIPERSIDIQETTRRADEYIRTNKEKKSKLREMSEAEGFVKNLKPIFAAISEEDYTELPNLCDNQEYLTVLQEYVEEHRHLVNLARVYERVIESTLENRDISLNTLAAINQIKDHSKEKVEAWVRRLNNGKKDERIKGQHWEAREEDLKREIGTLKETLQRQTQQIRELENEIQTNKGMFEQFQRDIDSKIVEYQKTINNLQLENTNIENKYEQAVEKLRQLQDQGSKGGQSNLETIEFIKNIADKDVILHELTLTPKHCHSLMERLRHCLPSFSSLKLLYRHSRHFQSAAFHKIVDLQQNILLVGKTKQGRIFGGFTTLPFDPTHRKHSPPDTLTNLKAFLFTLYRDEVSFFPLKEGMDSVEHDEDYIIFGNAEICIDRHSFKADSQFVSHKQEYLHYSDTHRLRGYFLSDREEDSAELVGYEIYQAVV